MKPCAGAPSKCCLAPLSSARLSIWPPIRARFRGMLISACRRSSGHMATIWVTSGLSSKRHSAPTPMSTLLPSSQALGDSLIQRVMSLIETPFDKLAESEAAERRELGARRCKETLSSTPWYAKKAAQAAAEGREPDYWKDLWQQHCNLVHPPVASSTPAKPPATSQQRLQPFATPPQ
ncbi:hypothetical protein D9M73_170440 [compost metagenome]